MNIDDEPTPVADAEETVITAIKNTNFTLYEATITEGILRFDIDCGGLPRVPDARNPVVNYPALFSDGGRFFDGRASCFYDRTCKHTSRFSCIHSGSSLHRR